LNERKCEHDSDRHAESGDGKGDEPAKDFPLGRGLIFPKLKREGDRFLPAFDYPKSFLQQEKFERELLL